MLIIMKEFLGLEGYARTPEGYMSWQHLTFVSILMALMAFLAIFFGKKNHDKDDKTKNKVLIISAILIDRILVKSIARFARNTVDALK